MRKLLLIFAVAIISPLCLEAAEPSNMVKVHPIASNITFAGEKVPVNYPYVKEAIDREILTTSCMHTRTMLTLRNMSRYFPVIEPILKEYGVPNDFKYLAMAESGLDPNAYSPAKAAGLWQFIPSAASGYGLETGQNTDMRYHVEASTRAACHYLLQAYKRFGNWTLAAASYNAGQAGVARRMETQGVNNYWDLYLPEETMRYILRIISLKIISSDPATYNFKLEEADMHKAFKNYKIVKVSHKDIDWSKFAKQHGTTYRQLRILNPWIRSYEYSNGGGTEYEVMVPTEKFKVLGY